MPGASPWSNCCIATVGAVASVFLPHLPFGTIDPLGLHDAEYILELQLQPYWMALELLVEDGKGVETFPQLQFGMWLVALPAQGDHAVPIPILTGWFTNLLEFCDGFCG